ncbi:50S ribosomal protein L6 [Candidatus Woesearchaeota archaeon]|nr:50S ribosomal protein L6 [Candidatus Woesearchaeota archaeon]
MDETIKIPEKVTAASDGQKLTVRGPKGEVTRNFTSATVNVAAEESGITLKSKRDSKRERKIAGSYRAHIKNMIQGALEGHRYKMKILSGHFPISVKAEGRQFTVSNYFGEKLPRKFTIPEGVQVKTSGSEIDIESCDKELAGATMGAIEKLTRRTAFDRRRFQDGIIMVVPNA